MHLKGRPFLVEETTRGGLAGRPSSFRCRASPNATHPPPQAVARCGADRPNHLETQPRARSSPPNHPTRNRDNHETQNPLNHWAEPHPTTRDQPLNHRTEPHHPRPNPLNHQTKPAPLSGPNPLNHRPNPLNRLADPAPPPEPHPLNHQTKPAPPPGPQTCPTTGPKPTQPPAQNPLSHHPQQRPSQNHPRPNKSLDPNPPNVTDMAPHQSFHSRRIAICEQVQ